MAGLCSPAIGIAESPDELVVDGDAGRRDHQAATFLLEALAGDRLDPDAGAVER